MQVIIYQTNAFTDLPFGGESTGVIPDASSLSEEDIQRIIRVLKLERTAFIYRIDDKNYRMRFFSKSKEIKFCGYATVASFFTMAQKGYIDGYVDGKTRVYQHTEIGVYPVDIHFKDWNVELVEMHKSSPTLLQIYRNLEGTRELLGIDEGDIGIEGRRIYPEVVYSGSSDIIIPLKRREIIGHIRPNHQRILEKLEEMKISIDDAPRIHLFALNDDRNIVCRQFEITDRNLVERSCSGTANAGLMFYLKRNKILNVREICCHQGDFMDSPSTIYCEMSDKNEEYPIKISGKGIVYFEGVITL